MRDQLLLSFNIALISNRCDAMRCDAQLNAALCGSRRYNISNDRKCYRSFCLFFMAFSARLRVHYLSISWMLMNNFNGHLSIHLHTKCTIILLCVLIFDSAGRPIIWCLGSHLIIVSLSLRISLCSFAACSVLLCISFIQAFFPFPRQKCGIRRQTIKVIFMVKNDLFGMKWLA